MLVLVGRCGGGGAGGRGGRGGGVYPQVNKFVQISSDVHQISVAGQGVSPKSQCIMDNGHMGTPPCGQNDWQTNTCENITSPSNFVYRSVDILYKNMALVLSIQ